MAGLITGGEVRVHGCPQDRLVTAITTLARMGAQFEITDDWITASAPYGLRPAAVQTDTHPGFMTDWQTPLMVLFTQAEGMSVLHETVFENRLVYVPALKKMGCEIEMFDACLGGEACRFHDTQRHALGGRSGACPSCAAPTSRCPTSGPGSPPCWPRPWPTAVDAARHPPHRARLPPAVRAVRLARAPHPAWLSPPAAAEGLIPNGLAILPL